MEDNYLIYEQDEIQYLSCSEGESTPHSGKLRIIEKAGEPIIEWYPTLDDSSDGDWAVISTPNVAFSTKHVTDSVTINNYKRSPSQISIKVEDNSYCRLTDKKKRLEILDKDEKRLAIFVFQNQNSHYFFDVLCRYVTTRQQDKDPSLYLLQNNQQADIDDRLSALNLVPKRSSPKEHPKHVPHGHAHHSWSSEAPKKVWSFIHNMKKDPYTTTLSTFSKFYDVVLYGDNDIQEMFREESEETGEILQRISGLKDLEPGFEILTKREQLADRPTIDRLTPLSHEEYRTFVDSEGRINQVQSLKQRIFRGGIHPNLRPELWCYLLGFYDWNLCCAEREERRKVKEHEYFVMKQQWKTFTEVQERNFAGFRDRKSIIEKDVNRTDRNHPFYEGESNANLQMLNDVLMTYIMYNFDLGYVQGMSDLLAPILYVVQSEALAFWCFVGYMDTVHRNFDLDQSGMKQQLSDLAQVLRMLDPEFVSFLQVQDSANLYFCFRWILVRFKRELNYADTLRLWEVLWTEHLCSNFHLCVAAALLETERKEIVENEYGFTEILKHINLLSFNIDLDVILKKAEALHVQLSNSESVPNSVRSILNIPKSEEPDVVSPTSVSVGVGEGPRIPSGSLPGRAERVSTTPGSNTKTSSKTETVLGSVSGAVGSVMNQLATEEEEDREGELAFEKGVSHSFI